MEKELVKTFTHDGATFKAVGNVVPNGETPIMHVDIFDASGALFASMQDESSVETMLDWFDDEAATFAELHAAAA